MSRIILAAAVGAAGLLASAGARATIVNISATANGEQTGGADCNTACVGPLISPVQVVFAAGTYTLDDAWNPATGFEGGATYDAWNFESGNGRAWVWHWKALLDDGSDGSTIEGANYAAHLLLDVDQPNPQDAFPTEAQAAVFGATTTPSMLTFSQTTTVDFVVNDDYLPDNTGGVSLDIEPMSAPPPPPPPPSAVPEPASWAMMLAGSALLGGALRRRAAWNLASPA